MASVAGEVLKEGFLVKKGHVRHNWRTRWFVLLKSEFLYFRTRRDRIPAGIISLNGADLVCPPSEASRKPWLLHLTTQDNKLYQIQAEDQRSRDDWRRAIEDSIRKLDPAKLDREMSPTRTLVRQESFISTNNSLREIVQAMQDRNAGVPLREFRLKGAGPRIKRFFTGKDVIDWLISWSFAEDRHSAISLGSEMLQYGFFNLLRLDEKEGMCRKVRDSLLVKEMVDSHDSTYDFVVFAPGESVDLFNVRLSEEEEEDGGSESDSDSEEEVPAKRTHGSSSTIGQGEAPEKKVIKQGFLLKKGKRRHNWKARKFVLRENDSVLTYSKGSKKNRILGEIALKDLTVIEKDVDKNDSFTGSPRNGASVKSCVISSTNSLPYNASNSKTTKKCRLVLLTAVGVRYELEANNMEERESWVLHIRAAIESC